jgi:hypothetical protein
MVAPMSPDQTNTAEAVELGRIGNDPVEHDLKCWPEYYQAIADGRKMHEVRQNDRDFRVGDRLRLHEWDPVTRRASGRQLVRSVTYIGTWDQKPGNVVMSLAPPELDRLRSRIMELEKALASRVGSRSGPAMTAVVAALHERPDHEWTTAEVLASAPAFVSKQIYNALGYLVRHGRLNKSGYGRYRLPADRVLTEGRK